MVKHTNVTWLFYCLELDLLQLNLQTGILPRISTGQNVDISIKALFIRYAKQLHVLVEKIPATEFEQALAPDMFCLAMNAKIAVNFLVRGYSPLVTNNQSSLPRFKDSDDKAQVTTQIVEVINWLEAQPKVLNLDETKFVSEKAGERTVELSQPDFIYHYIVPNFMFHMSMVYAVARQSGVPISKGDFDGLHSYSAGFSFVSTETVE